MKHEKYKTNPQNDFQRKSHNTIVCVGGPDWLSSDDMGVYRSVWISQIQLSTMVSTIKYKEEEKEIHIAWVTNLLSLLFQSGGLWVGGWVVGGIENKVT
jgi:hypothetical protein